MTDPGPDQAPPIDTEAEQAALGEMMMTRQAALKGFSILSEEDFYPEAHRLIFSAMRKLHDEGGVIEPVSVGSILKRQGTLGTCGGSEYLTALLGEAMTPAHIERHATIVHDLGRLRRIARVASEAAHAAYEQDKKPEELVREYLSRLQTIAGDCASDRTALPTRDGIEAFAARIERQRTRGEEVSAARFGLPWIDARLNGLADWGMIVVRGGTKMGKSLLTGNGTMATCQALASAPDDDRVVLAYVLEAIEEWEERCLAWLARIDKRKLEGRGEMNDAEEERYERALAEWASLPLYRTDRLTHIDEIRLDIEQQIMQGREPALIVVDHFQRLAGEGETATLRYDDAAQKLAQIPREHGCPLLVPSQVTEKKGAQRQSMWSRRLDQEATVVFDITGERDEDLRILRPTLPRKYVPFGEGRYYVSSNFDARLWDEPTYHMMQGGRRD